MDMAKAGFVWTIEAIKDGIVIERETKHNLIPIEGINYLIAAGLKGGSPFTSWYVGLYGGSYTPQSTDTAAAFPASATEITAYSQTARVPLILGTVANGQVDNTASTASFTGTTNGTLVNGGFITAASAKGATTSVLISAVQFSSPKAFDSGTIIQITAGFSISSN